MAAGPAAPASSTTKVGGRGAEASPEQWLFTPEDLARTRETVSNQAAEALHAALSRAGTSEAERRAAPRFLSLDDSWRLVLFYAGKLAELCGLCGAPFDVRWAAVVFYHRFFTARSPAEFDPVPMMFACVHVACKIEEVHTITLDKILEAADLGANAALRAKVAALELPLLEGLRFALLVEPKPDSALRMLVAELRETAKIGSGVPMPAMEEADWEDLVLSAEELVLDLAVRSDAVLRWPASVLTTASLSAAAEEHFRNGRGSDDGSRVQAFCNRLAQVLEADLKVPAQKAAFRTMLQGARAELARVTSSEPLGEEAVKGPLRSARKCHKVFERVREDAAVREEASRMDRKRVWSQTKSESRAVVPPAVLQDIMDLNRKVGAIPAKTT